MGLRLGPGRRAEDAIAVAAIGVFRRNFYDFFEKAVIKRGGFKPKLDEATVVHDQIILHRFVAWVWKMV